MIAVAFIFLAFGASQAAAATYYVWEGANGSNNGSSWTNAWTSLSSTSNISAGDTVYIAQGQYGSLSCSDANATYLRATTGDHGSNTGWSNDMDGRVILSGIIDINADGVTVDGRTKYGIKVTGGSPSGAIDIYGDQDNVTVKYIELDGSGEPGGPCSWRAMRVHDAYNGGYVDNLTVSHIYMHNYYNDCIKWVDVRDSVIEHTIFGPRSGSCSEHGDAMEVFGTSSNITIRYSDFNWNGQQIFFGARSTNTNWLIYGNTFHDGTNASGVGIHPKDQSDTSGSVTVYNNTFYNLTRAHDFTPWFSGTAKNNLYYDIGTRAYGGLSSSSNLVASSNPFVSASSDNYRLASPTTAGDTLSSAFSRDPDGKTRGADGNWDMGAFEYGPGGDGGGTDPEPDPEPDPTPVTVPIPTGLRLASVVDGQLIAPVSVNASGDDGNVAANTLDNDYNTRWSAQGNGEWIQYEFDTQKCISNVLIAFYQGDSRAANFTIATSTDGSSWDEVYNGTSTGSTTEMENYDAMAGTTAKFLRITGYGNDLNSWNSITEVDIYECGN